MTEAERAAFWRGKRVLVTGGAGFLGSALCHALAALGARTTALDVMNPDGGANMANLEGAGVLLVRGDIRDVELHSLCQDVDVLFNMAAQTSHMGGQKDPVADIAINAVAQVRLIGVMRDAAPKATVVHASTRQFYGRPLSLPVDELHPVNPPDANGVSKWAGEQYWLLEQRVLKRPVVSLRLTNCYGPRLRIRDARQTFLGIWIRQVLKGEPFEVWGGEQLRDLTYVDDVVRAFLLAAEAAPQPEVAGRVFNLGGSPPASLLDLAERLIAANDGRGHYSVKEFPADRAPIDIGSYHADDRAFREATGWAPLVGLDEGLRRSLDWYRSRLADYT
ncbi:NAD-dependent epimerase/dehydratase family protein [Siccirubricoccus sp. KC 17139]|uniref:NAD-dependent epimerase/dehydratase family protein n=1 Tax=Siccirubricoccus soli TaxID=2899147 RepID=A0ABT1D326_9PROT|nr:NAD-dependent epimerase/dehydratase family protein [Siccirubricoccus soli]MCO6416333.1 NAD-dependent epimerase/dehydratase family protein [Siccirubricoccus soli]MCP2682467.1 NAD-dependent epimerase/dehydratase family protein [Siccirubricoccus soli]